MSVHETIASLLEGFAHSFGLEPGEQLTLLSRFAAAHHLELPPYVIVGDFVADIEGQVRPEVFELWLHQEADRINGLITPRRPFVTVERWDDEQVLITTQDGVCQFLRKPQMGVRINQTKLSAVSLSRLLLAVEPILAGQQVPNLALATLTTSQRELLDQALVSLRPRLWHDGSRAEINQIRALLGLVGEDAHDY